MNVTLYPLWGEFHGRVTDAITGTPLPAQIMFDFAWATQKIAYTDTNGWYSMTNIPCRSANVAVASQFYNTFSTNSYTAFYLKTNVLNAALTRATANLTGRALDASGYLVITGATVYLNSTYGTNTYTTKTDSNGYYQLTNVYTGTGTLTVVSYICQTNSQPVTLDTPWNLNSNTTVNLAMDYAPTVLRGKVTDKSTGSPLAGALVTYSYQIHPFYDPTNYVGVTNSVTTDGNGYYQFSIYPATQASGYPSTWTPTDFGPKPGSGVLSVSLQDFHAYQKPWPDVAYPGPNTKNVILMPMAASVRINSVTQRPQTKLVDIVFSYTNPEGDPLSNVIVKVSANGGTKFTLPATSFTPTNGTTYTPGGMQTITWDAGADWMNQSSDEMAFLLKGTIPGAGDHSATSQVMIVVTLTNGPPVVQDVTVYDWRRGAVCSGQYPTGPNYACFLAGISHSVTFKPHVDWNGHPTGTVSAVEGYQPKSDGSFKFDVGTDLTYGSSLTIIAASPDGTQSQPFRANFDIVQTPLGMPAGLLWYDDTQGFYTLPFLSLLQGMSFSKDTPNGKSGKPTPNVSGSKNEITGQFSLTGQVNTDGSYNFGVKAGGGGANSKDTPKGNNLKHAFTIEVGGGVDGNYEQKVADYTIDGYLSLTAGYTFTFEIPLLEVLPLYLDITVGMSLGAQLHMLYDPAHPDLGVQFSGQFPMSLTLGAALQIGWPCLNVQIGFYATLAAVFQVPEEPICKTLDFIISVEATETVLWWSWHQVIWKDIIHIYPDTSPSKALEDNIRATLAVPQRPANSEFKLMSRDYLTQPAVVTPRPAAVRKKAAKREDYVAASSGTVTNNVFPIPQPQLAVTPANTLLLWVTDDPARSSANRTELVWQRLIGNRWSSPQPVWDNGTGDSAPVVGVFADGSALAVWEKQAHPLPDSATLDDGLANGELAAARFDPVTSRWTATYLTGSGYYQHSPQLAVAGNGTALLTWIGNASNDTVGAVSMPNTIYSRRWNGHAWDSTSVLASNVPMLCNATVAYNGTNGVFLATIDGDDNQNTVADQKLYGASYSNGIWSGLACLTTNTIQNTKPQAIYDSDGELLVAWYQGSNIVTHAGDLNLSQVTVAASLRGSVSEKDFKLITGPQGQISMVWQGVLPDSGRVAQPLLVNYDTTMAAWSHPLCLMNNTNQLAGAFSGAYGTNGAVRLAYTYTLVTSDTNNLPQFGQVDLMYLDYLISSDLAVFDNDVSLSTNAVPGQPVNILASVHNQGELAANNVPVAFYDGEPGRGGAQIGSTQIIPGILSAGTNATAQVTWNVPSTTNSHTIYVVVDPAVTFSDRNRDNNTATLSVLAPDLQVSRVTVSQIDVTNRLITAAIVNIGTIPTPDLAEVTFRLGATNGPVLMDVPIGIVPTGGTYNASFVWHMAGLTFTNSAEKVYANIDEGHMITEASQNKKTGLVAVRILLDSVGDGIADWWRAKYFGGDGSTTNSDSCATCDPNHTGYSNLQAYQLGVNPLAANRQVNLPVIATTSPLPAGTKGVAYRQVFEATSGMPPYQWQVSAGQLPAGLALNATTGIVTGKPTVAGISNFRMTVVDSQHQSATNGFSVLIRNVTASRGDTYTGLLIQTNTPTHASSGFIQIVQNTNGAYAAHLILAGKKAAFKGSFDATGNASNSVSGLDVTLHTDRDNGRITGTVAGSNFTSELLAELADVSSKWQGTYTLALSPADVTATNIPQGYGYAKLIVNRTGSARISGVLNDGTAISAQAPVSVSGFWPLYAGLYPNGGTPAGACVGWLSFETNRTVTALVDWFAPASAGYSAFSTTLTLQGSQYTTGVRPLQGSWDVTLSGGGLTSNLVKTVAITAAGKVTVSNPGADALTLKLLTAPVAGQLITPVTTKAGAALSGQFTGSFKPTGTGKAISFTGLLLQQQKTGDGLFKSTTGKTGGVTLTPAP